MDRLLGCCEDKGAPVCVGIDPVFERLPGSLRDAEDSGPQVRLEAIGRFCRGVLAVVAPHVPAVKIQAACFERYRAPGVALYERLVDEARGLGLIVIADAKRGDIGISAEHYAAGCLEPSGEADPHSTEGPDALTVNAYFGADSLQPFVESAWRFAKGLFALVRTSNPDGDALQGLALADGRTVGQAVAQIVAKSGSERRFVGRRGYSLLGAVVGATKADAAALRALMPQQLFLVPGFGAQGAGVKEVRACFKEDGTGALITASRSVLYAYEKHETDDWQGAVEAATLRMKQEVAGIV